MFNLLKYTGYAFLITISINQIKSMEHKRVRYNDFGNQSAFLKKKTSSLNKLTLKKLVVDKICEQIRLKCQDETIFTKSPLEIQAIINDNYLKYLPQELIDNIKTRFLKRYGHGGISLIKKFQPFNQPIIQFKTSGNNIAMLSKDFRLCIYNYKIDAKNYFENIKAFEFLPNGHLAAVCKSGIFVIDKDSYEIKLQIESNLNGTIKNIIAMSDNKIIIALSDRLSICELNSGKIYELSQTKNEHQAEIISVTQLTNEKICTNSFDKTLKIWDSNTGELLATIESDKQAIFKKPLILQNENIVYLEYLETSFSIYDVQNQKILNNIDITHHLEPSNSYPFLDITHHIESPYRRSVSSSGYTAIREILISPHNIITVGDFILVWDITFEGGKLIKKFSRDSKDTQFSRHINAINSIIMLNENLIASCSEDYTLQIWNYRTGLLLSSYKEVKPLKKLIKLENNLIAAYNEDGILYFYSTPSFENKIANIAMNALESQRARNQISSSPVHYFRTPLLENSEKIILENLNADNENTVPSLKNLILDLICSRLEQTYGLSNYTKKEIKYKIKQLYTSEENLEFFIEEITNYFCYKYGKN